ncbi:MAG TPA: 30S ribosomal protein S16 [Terriglobales bacterium]|nr:30S ribosomal protein S16 [Terriglobales bacterium]
MSVKIRLSRHGAKKNPFYRIVVSDERAPRDGRYIEQVGTYAPRTAGAALNIDHEKVQSWIQRGAKPTQTVSNLIAKQKKAV